MSWVLAFAGFALLIILHEWGHFAVAKKVGMKVEKFYLFFPPKLWSVRRGETEYGIGAIPLGGFVKIAGMNPDEEMDPAEAHRGYYHQPVWKRIVVIAAGPAVNIVLAFVILFGLAMTAEQATNVVGQVLTAPATEQLEPGDKIVSVDGVSGDLETMRDQVATHECAGGEQTDGCVAETPARVVIERDGEQQLLLIKPVYDAANQRPLLGFAYGTEPADNSVGESASISAGFMWDVTATTVGVIGRIFEQEQREQISGVVGSYEVTRQAIQFSARRALTLLAVISLSLGVLNLFPFLPLDGGHIFWSIVEKIRGRPVSFDVMYKAGMVGFVLVAMLAFIGLSNDIGRLTGEGFGTGP